MSRYLLNIQRTEKETTRSQRKQETFSLRYLNCWYCKMLLYGQGINIREHLVEHTRRIANTRLFSIFLDIVKSLNFDSYGVRKVAE